MRKLLTILFVLVTLKVTSQTANAGLDKLIYLTQTSIASIGGSSSGTSYLWTDISTDRTDPATITFPTAVNTTITGMVQGTWYFQIAVTTGATTVRDTVVVRVDYDVPPINGTLVRWLDMPGIAPTVNLRDDTTTYFNTLNAKYSQPTASPNTYYLYRGRTNGLMIDSLRGKLYTIIEDGYGGEGNPTFARSEIQLGNLDLDTSTTYLFEWKGYFPQSNNFLSSWYAILTFFQVHGYAQVPTVFSFNLASDNSLQSLDYYNGATVLGPLSNLTNFYNQTHTVRVTWKEGKSYPGQTAFIKVQLDGVQKYYRDTGQVGSLNDFVKFAGLYDWNRAVVNPDSLARGRKYSLVTEKFSAYTLSNIPIPLSSKNYIQIRHGKLKFQ